MTRIAPWSALWTKELKPVTILIRYTLRESSMTFSWQFLRDKERHLEYRLQSKRGILKKGGEQAVLHSPQDLTRIEYALQRIKDGQYGLCTNCGIPINVDRLEIIPETPFCISCAEMLTTQH